MPASLGVSVGLVRSVLRTGNPSISGGRLLVRAVCLIGPTFGSELNDLSQNTDGDLFRALGADFQPDGGMNAVEFCVGDAIGAEAIVDGFAFFQASDHSDFEADFNSGALAVEFEDPPAKFIVSPNSPVRQIWVSAHSKSFKLDWDTSRETFVLPDSGQTLAELMQSAISQQLGEEIAL